ncbi:hypothetical protein YC2023_014408 [Brassica napus]
MIGHFTVFFLNTLSSFSLFPNGVFPWMSEPFVGGDWRSGGTCHIETPPDFGASLVPSGHGNIQEKFKDG